MPASHRGIAVLLCASSNGTLTRSLSYGEKLVFKSKTAVGKWMFLAGLFGRPLGGRLGARPAL